MTSRFPGFCPICQRSVTFLQRGDWLRDELFCESCWSVPRQRALVHVLNVGRPGWRRERVWEMAPAGPASALLRDGSRQYFGTHFWPDVPSGVERDGVRCEDVEQPSFADGTLDVVVTSDVFEHVFDADKALRQIARVLSPGGIFIWTVPRYLDLEVSRVRAVRRGDTVENVLPAQYHGDPVNNDGILVTFDWGRDLADRVQQVSGLITVSYKIDALPLGISGEFIEVFISSKSLTALAPQPADADDSSETAEQRSSILAQPSWVRREARRYASGVKRRLRMPAR